MVLTVVHIPFNWCIKNGGYSLNSVSAFKSVCVRVEGAFILMFDGDERKKV